MNINRGTTIETAIKIPYKIYEQHKVEQTINEYIDQIFGGTDGDYFVMNSMKRRNMQGTEFKIVLVEDRDQIKHQVYFELIQIKEKT